MTFTHALATDNYGTAKFIVSAQAYEGTHTTIAAALTSASSGDTIFIRPGTYTENLTLKAGVNLSAFDCDALTPNVNIVGTLSASFAGTASISGIRLTTNGAVLVAVSGSAATDLSFSNCLLNCTNASALTNSTTGGGVVKFYRCEGNLGTTGINYFAQTGLNDLQFFHCFLNNTGGSTTSSTVAGTGCTLEGYYTYFNNQITTSASGACSFEYSFITVGGGINQVALTAGGSGGGFAHHSHFETNSVSAVSISTAFNLYACTINSGNTNAITGTGTMTYTDLIFIGSSSGINSTLSTSATYTSLGSYRAQLQPAFNAWLNSNVTNATGNGNQWQLGTTTALTIIFDQLGNITTGGVFTAPITGKYFFVYVFRVANITIGNTLNTQLVTTAHTYFNCSINPTATKGNDGNLSVTQSYFVNMTAGDTATASIIIQGEAGNTNTIIGGNGATYFAGYLVC